MSLTLFPPTPTNVRNMPPRGRQGRRRCREEIEKSFLKNRHEGFQRYGDDIDKPFEVDKRAVAFMSDADRFHTDTAGEAKKAREVENAYKEALWNAKLRDAEERDNKRWAEMEMEARRKEEQFALWRATGQKNRNNQTSAPFNPVTLTIEPSSRGDALRQTDEMIRFRAMVRMKELNSRTNGTHNPITGQLLPVVELPKRPPPSVEYAGSYYPANEMY
mmetsp:Transcript_22675/g.44893  ORF Transcript_22675/g.44893 Transcript_22675/m.44893 type:complete len:218 (+) Transcript_22675:32-685(+)|eukprot:CAMPEP_0175141174 /NCGR_PEP_ID=MMETSP0087-20121206/11948_1 /TAXON_ID=136419 /ORGANISM="Unknown Unknown, Strain D1" /LENGTH=217 /DNA_ID=CAMNT_0016424539 /DNA_START=98 /DNA_END=751 /DNA_ORIENTATION=+